MEHIGCSDPDDEASTSVKTVNSVNHYSNVFSWVDNMKDIAKLKSEDVVRSHMSYSLKNKATDWYDAELTSVEKEALRILPLEE